MAVTSIWPIKGRVGKVLDYAMNPEKTEIRSAHQLAMHLIANVAEYAADDLKTERRELVTGVNCTTDNPAKEFLETQRFYEKCAGRVCYHGYQSFAPGEVDAETAHKIGVELARQLWGDRFEVLIATHYNTGCYHNHFVINAVSFLDGKKFYNSHEDYRRMREISDGLCRAYGLSIVQPEGRGKNHQEWAAEQAGKPTRRSMICEDIERGIRASTTPEHFYQVMAEMGYEIKTTSDNGTPLKYPAIRPPGAKGFFRFHKLAKGYSWEEILDRIYENMRRELPFPDAERRRNLPRPFVPYPKAKGLRALYWKYCFELHILVKHPTSTKRVHFALREDIAKLEALDAQSRFLALHQIDTLEQLNAHREQVQEQIRQLDAQRRKLRDQRREKPEEDLSAQIDALREVRKELRKEVVLCNTIESRSADVERNLAALQAEQQREQAAEELQGKEETEHEQFRRSSGSGRQDVSEWD